MFTMSIELQFLIVIMIFRIMMVFVVETSFVPDEYWQGPEVAHKLVFGYGHLTWEWLTGLRSYLYPAFLAIPYWILKYLNADSRAMIMLIPRIQQSIVTALGDFYFLKYCSLRYGSALTRIVAWLYFSNWFIVYCGARTLGNTMEMSLNLIGLYLLEKNHMYKFTLLMGLNFVMRPSAIVYWIPFAPKVLREFVRRPYMFLSCCFIGFSVLHVTYVIDTVTYGKPTFSWWNFIDFNYLQGKSALFGTHPFHWYISNCLLLLGGGHFILFIIGQIRMIRQFRLHYFIAGGPCHMETLLIFFYVALYSLVAHKELRFMLPILPNLLIVSASIINSYYLTGNRDIINKFIVPFLVLTALFDLGILGYSSKYHLGGISPATNFISNSIAERNIEKPLIWILMPCYSVPVYTHFHNPNATIEFFTCPPLELDLNMTNLQLRDFSDIDLDHFVRMKTADYGHPDFVMFFSPLLSKMTDIYPNYDRCFESFHTNFTEGNVGKYVNVLCRTDYD